MSYILTVIIETYEFHRQSHVIFLEGHFQVFLAEHRLYKIIMNHRVLEESIQNERCSRMNFLCLLIFLKEMI